MAIRISLLGGAGCVTGSHFLAESEGTKILIDCGLEQGRNFCELAAYEPFPYGPATADALFITHAHLDHIGRIPKLVRDGFKGAIYSTPPTRDLAELILHDSIMILAEDAKKCGVKPLYGKEDVERAFSLWKTIKYHEETKVGNLSMYLRQTGHILGSASIRIRANDGTTVAFTGDIGHPPSPLIPDWEKVDDADAVVMESVYGDRLHQHHDDRVQVLKEKVGAAIARGGTILIPAFSIERTQLMLYELSNLFADGSLPKIPVFLDSPLAIAVTEVYRKYGQEYLRPEAEAERIKEHDLYNFPFLKMTSSREESESITHVPNPKIIIAGAGMSHGGRIGRHEVRYLPDAKTTLFIVGYQAPGSPGRHLQEGVKKVHLNGQDVTIRAHIETMSGWSGHADRDELVRFATTTQPRAKVIFTALGEPASENFLAQRIHDFVGARAISAVQNQVWDISKDGAKQVIA